MEKSSNDSNRTSALMRSDTEKQKCQIQQL